VRPQLNRSDLALVMMSQLASGAGEQYPLDRIRIQKAMFLLTRRGNPDWRELFKYRPYNWGPYSSQLAADMDSLVRQGLVEVEEVRGNQYPRYRTTAAGEARVATIWPALQGPERDFLRSVRSYVTGRSFTQLLREVYAEYPEFAVASYFSG
jgi:hypothetical protein